MSKFQSLSEGAPAPPNLPATPAPAVQLEQLKAQVVLMTDRLIQWSDAPFKRASGTVLAANARWAAMDLGDRVQILDREKWPVEEGCRYVLNAEVATPSVTRRPVDTNTASALQHSYGDRIGSLARGWVARDKALGLAKGKDRRHGF